MRLHLKPSADTRKSVIFPSSHRKRVFARSRALMREQSVSKGVRQGLCPLNEGPRLHGNKGVGKRLHGNQGVGNQLHGNQGVGNLGQCRKPATYVEKVATSIGTIPR